jgi:hypothetical protein
VKGHYPFPEEEVVMSIYDGLVPHETLCKLNLTSQEVNALSPATLEHLRWSESPITFDQTDYPDCVLKLGRFPLIVDPLARTTRLTKALMDGGCGRPHVPRHLQGAMTRSRHDQNHHVPNL